VREWRKEEEEEEELGYNELESAGSKGRNILTECRAVSNHMKIKQWKGVKLQVLIAEPCQTI
jgi:hypothetical protein